MNTTHLDNKVSQDELGTIKWGYAQTPPSSLGIDRETLTLMCFLY